jgi:23S rRNA (guanosine2251-2'-O)-methyltransferase
MKKNFIYGIRTTIEAINSGKNIEKILFKKNLKSPLFYELFNLAKKNKIPFQFVPPEKINKYTSKNHQGVIAFVSLISYTDIEQLTQMLFDNGEMPLFLILDKITDVRNFGAIARTAECAGVNALIIKDKGSAQINNDAIKTSQGALYKIPVCRVHKLNTTIEFLKNSGLQIIAASEKASKFYFKQDFTLPTAIIMGAEDKGIEPDILKLANSIVKIPIIGEIKSLNVANAASILIYEALRQRLS